MIRIVIADPSKFAPEPDNCDVWAPSPNRDAFDALVGFGARAETRTIGIEVLTPAIAHRCGAGNIDPQHGAHIAPPHEHEFGPPDPAWPAPLPGESACAFAVRLVEAGAGFMAGTVDAPDVYTILLERSGARSGDLDGWCAAAVLVLGARWADAVRTRERRVEAAAWATDPVTPWMLADAMEPAISFLSLETRERIAAVAAADAFSPSKLAWAPSPLPTAADPWPAIAESSVDSRRTLAAIDALVKDGMISIERRLAAVMEWLCNGEWTYEEAEAGNFQGLMLLAEYRERIEATRMALIGAVARAGAVRVFPSEGMSDKCSIAIVEIGEPGALGVGYALAPRVVARHPATGKITIASWGGNYLDSRAMWAALNDAEIRVRGGGDPAKGWGGSTAGAGGSPLDGTCLTLEEIVSVVAECVIDPREKATLFLTHLVDTYRERARGGGQIDRLADLLCTASPEDEARWQEFRAILGDAALDEIVSTHAALNA